MAETPRRYELVLWHVEGHSHLRQARIVVPRVIRGELRAHILIFEITGETLEELARDLTVALLELAAQAPDVESAMLSYDPSKHVEWDPYLVLEGRRTVVTGGSAPPDVGKLRAELERLERELGQAFSGDEDR